jgi:hypothetical protein
MNPEQKARKFCVKTAAGVLRRPRAKECRQK